jgi:hypothetical protein
MTFRRAGIGSSAYTPRRCILDSRISSLKQVYRGSITGDLIRLVPIVFWHCSPRRRDSGNLRPNSSAAVARMAYARWSDCSGSAPGAAVSSGCFARWRTAFPVIFREFTSGRQPHGRAGQPVPSSGVAGFAPREILRRQSHRQSPPAGKPGAEHKATADVAGNRAWNLPAGPPMEPASRTRNALRQLSRNPEVTFPERRRDRGKKAAEKAGFLSPRVPLTPADGFRFQEG